MGARQVFPLCAVPGRRQAVPVGPGAARQTHFFALDFGQRRGADHDDAGRDPAVDERAARFRQADQEGARALRHRQGAARHRHDGNRHASRARSRGHRSGRRSAGAARRARNQDRGRDRASQDGVGDGRCDLCRHMQGDPARHEGKRTRRHRQRSPVPHGLRARRMREFGIGTSRAPAFPHVLGSHDPARRHDLPRHHAFLQRLSHLLLSHVHLRRAEQSRRSTLTRPPRSGSAPRST